MNTNFYKTILTFITSCFLFQGVVNAQCAGSALQFNGTNYVDAGGTSALNLFPLTVSAWVKTTQNDGNYTGIINKYLPGTGNGYNLFIHNGLICSYYYTDFSNYSVPPTDIGLDGGFISDGNWHYVSFVTDNSGSKMYVDGILKNSSSWTGVAGAPTTTTSLKIASYPGGSNFNGQVDEVSIFNAALSQSTIQQWKNSSINASHPDFSNLKGYWKFDEGSGATTTDASGNGNNGTLVNSPAWVTSTAPLLLRPVITSFTPVSAVAGTSVILNGSNFAPAAINNIVYFGATRATVTAASTSSLTVTVPLGATYASISVTNSCGLTGYSPKLFDPSFCGNTIVPQNPFVNQTSFAALNRTYAIAMGDLDGDGKNDIAAANYSPSYFMSVYRNTSTVGVLNSSSLAAKQDFATGSQPYDIAMSDIDGDGKLDVIVMSYPVAIFRNISTPGSISFAPKYDLPGGGTAMSVGDIDLDGKPDIFLGSGNANVYRNTSIPGTISFAGVVSIPAGGMTGVDIADLDGDGRPELIGAEYSSNRIGVIPNLTTPGNISIANFGSEMFTATLSNPYGLTTADLDGDGLKDIATVCRYSNYLQVFRNTSSGIGNFSLSASVDLNNGGGSNSIKAGDVNGDGRPDLIVGANTIGGFINNSSPGSLTPANFTLISLSNQRAYGNAAGKTVALGDLDNDGKPDFASCEDGTNIWISRNTISPAPATITASGPTTFCSGGSVTLTASAGSSYSWSTGATSQAITVNTSGSYTVTVTSANGCTSSVSQSVTVNPIPVATISASGPLTFCAGGSVTLTASAGTSYLWNNNATTASIPVTASGSYSVTVTQSGCSATSAPTVVSVNPNPAPAITSTGGTAAGVSTIFSGISGPEEVNFDNAGNTYFTTWNNVYKRDALGNTTVIFGGGVEFQGMAIDNAGNIYVSDYSVSRIYKLTPSGPTYTSSVFSTQIASPIDILIDNSGVIYAVAYFESKIYKLNAANGNATLFSTMGGSRGAYMNMDNSGNIYCATTYDGILRKITPAGVSSVAASFGTYTYGCAVAPDGKVYVSLYFNSQIFSYNPATNTTQLVLGNGAGYIDGALNVAKFNQPTQLSFDASGNLYAGDYGNSKFRKISFAPAVCQGNAVALDAGAGYSSYNWSTGATTQTINATATGNYSVTVANGSGCTGTTSQSVVVNPSPVATASSNSPICPSTILNLFSAGGASYSWTGPNGFTSSAQNPVINNATTAASGTYTVTVTSSLGCNATATTTVSVSDNQTPSITCPADISLIATGASGAVATYTAPVGTDNCPGVTTARTAGLASGSTFPIGVTTVTHTVTDGSGLTASCSFNVTVTGVAPQIVCPANIMVNTTPGTCGTNVSFAATETTGIPASTITYSIAPGSSFASGTTTVTATATNAVGTSTCSFHVTVNDNEAPVADVTSLPTVTGECSASVSAPTATDNCVGTVTGTTTDATSYSAQGTYTVTWTYDDGNGNTSSQTQTVIVDDVTAPVADVTSLPTVTGECSASVSAPSATDNCVGTVTGTTTDATSYSVQGTYTVTWTYNDGNGNTSSQTQTVIVDDVTAPVADVASLPTVTGECSASVSAPTATDNCVGTVTGTTTDATSYSAQGTYTVTWTYDDGNGNTSSQTQTVIVDDVTAPVADVTILPTVTGECSASVSAPTATDNCVGTVTGTTTDATSYSAQGTYTVTWTYDDGNGNTSSQTQTVIVDDVTAPVADIASLPTVTGECSASVSAPSATDNCVGTVTGTTTDATSYSAQGTYTVTWTYDDGNGNTSSQTQTVIVDDVTAPVADVTSLPTLTGECLASVSAPTATDNCVGTVTGTTTDATSYSAQGTYTVTWTYDDGNGNTSSQTQTVIVDDVTAPVADVTTLPTVTGECSASVSAPTATDNCVGTVSGTTTDATSYSAQGTYTVTWTYNDGNGNTSSQTQTVIIHDVTAPVITCPADITIGQCNNVVAFSVTATDNCAGPVTVVSTPASGSAFPVGVTTVNSTATDASGNQSSCSFTVTILASPVATATYNTGVCQNTTLSLTSSGGTSYSWAGPGGFTSTLQNPTRTGATPAMSGDYTVTVSNGSGCTSSATVNVVVNPLPGTPTALTGTSSVLRGGTYTYSATVPNATSYTWTYSGTGATFSGNTNPVTVTFACNATNGNLTVKGVNSCGNGPAASVAVTTNAGATINIYSAKLTTGEGHHPSAVKTAIMPVNTPGSKLGFKVFRSNQIGITAKRKNFSRIWNGDCTGLGNNCHYNPSSDVTSQVTVTGPVLTTYGGGPAYKYVMTVPAGKRYLVIAQDDATQAGCSSNPYGVNPCYVYPGKRTNNKNGHHSQCDEDDDGDDDGDDDNHFNACNSKDMYLQIIEDAKGKIRPSNTDAIPGSMLLICSPDYVEFTDTVELLPIVYESVEGDWAMSTNATPPEGFYSVEGELTTEVNTSFMNALQFTLVDTGSEWTSTQLTTQMRHDGKDITHIASPDMINSKWTKDYLSQNFPNPFSNSTTIPYILPVDAKVRLSVFDMFGREVAVLSEKTQQKGLHTESWKPCEIASGCPFSDGIYLVRLQATSLEDGKMVVNSKSMIYIR